MSRVIQKRPPKPENLAPLIFFLRGEKVLLSQHLAELYGVTVSALNQAVKRNITRFPDDFMFQLTSEEFQLLKSQIVTSIRGAPLRSQTVTLKRGEHMI